MRSHINFDVRAVAATLFILLKAPQLLDQAAGPRFSLGFSPFRGVRGLKLAADALGSLGGR